MNLVDALGVDGGISVQSLTLYIPNKDRTGREIGDQRRWVLQAALLLARIGGGVTIMPPAEGGWLSPEGMTFLHALGRETNQGEVAFEFDGRFYRLTTFDEEGDRSWQSAARPTGRSATRRRRTRE